MSHKQGNNKSIPVPFSGLEQDHSYPCLLCLMPKMATWQGQHNVVECDQNGPTVYIRANTCFMSLVLYLIYNFNFIFNAIWSTFSYSLYNSLKHTKTGVLLGTYVPPAEVGWHKKRTTEIDKQLREWTER